MSLTILAEQSGEELKDTTFPAAWAAVGESVPEFNILQRSDLYKKIETKLQSDLEELAGNIGPRNLFLPENYRRSLDFITESFLKAGYDPVLEKFTPSATYAGMDAKPCANIVSTKLGTELPDERSEQPTPGSASSLMRSLQIKHGR